MKILLDRKKIVFMIVQIVLIGGLTSFARAEKTKTYENNGMKFTVGHNNPDKRIHPVKENVKVIKQTIIVNQNDETNNLPGIELEESADKNLEVELKQNNQNDSEDVDDKDKNVFQAIKEKVLAIEQKIEEILVKLGILEESAKNVDKLIETTSGLTNEITEQDKRIGTLEDKLLKKKVKLPDENN